MVAEIWASVILSFVDQLVALIKTDTFKYNWTMKLHLSITSHLAGKVI